jgi:hypothetical protein
VIFDRLFRTRRLRSAAQKKYGLRLGVTSDHFIFWLEGDSTYYHSTTPVKVLDRKAYENKSIDHILCEAWTVLTFSPQLCILPKSDLIYLAERRHDLTQEKCILQVVILEMSF